MDSARHVLQVLCMMTFETLPWTVRHGTRIKSKSCKGSFFNYVDPNMPIIDPLSILSSVDIGEGIPLLSSRGNLLTGKSLSEALIFASTSLQYDDRLFIKLQVQYMKIPSSNLGRTCCVHTIVSYILPMFCKRKSFWQRFTFYLYQLWLSFISLKVAVLCKIKPGFQSMWPAINSSSFVGGKFNFFKSCTRFAPQSWCCNFNQWGELNL